MINKITITDMVFVLTHLKAIKKPSARVKAAIAKLENTVCLNVENMKTYDFGPDGKLTQL